VPGLRVVAVEPEARFGRLCTVDVQAQLGQDVWDALIRDEIGRARAGGAEILATIYHGCQRLICPFEADGSIAIEHYLSVFARGLGIEFEDRFKKYRLWEDPERVLAESTACQTANHVDPARAKASPFGGTIAHGFLTLSLLSHLAERTFSFAERRMGVNYGLNRVRFTAPVPSGARVRARFTLAKFENIEGGVQVTWNTLIEREGSDKPALVAEWIGRHYY